MSLHLTLYDGTRTSLQVGDVIEWIDWGGGWCIRRVNGDSEVPILFRNAESGEQKRSYMVHQTRSLQLEPLAELFAAMAGLNIEKIDTHTWRCVAVL